MYKLCILLFSFLSFSCNCEKKALEQSNKELISQNLPISEIYYQSWVAGVRGGGSGINVHITFKDKLPMDVKLTKVQLLHYTSYAIDSIENDTYVARIKTEANQINLEEIDTNQEINNSGDNQTKNLGKGEVLLTFEKNGQIFTQLIQNVQQKEMLAFPSAKPRN